MNISPRTLISFACATFALAPIAAIADTPATPAAAPAIVAAPKAANNAEGKISSIDTTAKTITVTSHHGANSTTFGWDDSTKIYRTSAGALSDIKVGDSIRAYGSATPEAPTLTPTHILVVPNAAAGGHKKTAKAGFHRNRVDGVVASTTPTLTLTTPGGVTVTVNATADTKVEKETIASPSDLTTGLDVQANFQKNAPSPLAATITIVPPHARRTAAK